MRARLILIVTAALAATACGPSQPAKPKQPIVVRSAEQDQLHRLNPMNRDIAMKRAIYASGYSCKRVERSGYVAEYKNMSMWTARCADKAEWAVFVGPDGTVQVRRCEDLARFGLPACIINPGGAAKPT